MNEEKPAPGRKPEPERNLVTKPSPAASEPVQGDLWPVAELIALERERIASRDRRTEITLFAGDDTQRAVANGLLETIVTGLGGFGVGWALLSGIRRSLSRRP